MPFVPKPYFLYGLTVSSSFPLFAPRSGKTAKAATPAIRIRENIPLLKNKRSSIPKEILSKKLPYFLFQDGSCYVGFFKTAEFWVSPDGKEIVYRLLTKDLREHRTALTQFLQANVLSFSLLRMGIEPVHGTGIAVKGKAIALIGESGYGKSTLGAAFLQAGFPLLTDDLLVIKKKVNTFTAFPGTPRIKLFPETARLLLKNKLSGTPMTPEAQKWILSLPAGHIQKNTLPLQAVFVLPSPAQKKRTRTIGIRKLSSREAAVEVLKAAYNLTPPSHERLLNQFDFASNLAGGVPVYALSYPEDLQQILKVRDFILKHLATSHRPRRKNLPTGKNVRFRQGPERVRGPIRKK